MQVGPKPRIRMKAVPVTSVPFQLSAFTDSPFFFLVAPLSFLPPVLEIILVSCICFHYFTNNYYYFIRADLIWI